MRRQKDVSNRSDELTYQLRRHDDVSAWSGAFKLVTKMDQFLLRTISVNFLGVSGGSVSLRHQLVRCYNVSKTFVSFRYQLWRLCDVLSWSVSLRYQLLTSLWRLKLVDFIYVPVRRRKGVSNRSVSLTYQLRLRDDILAWSATSRPKWDVATTSHAAWELGKPGWTYAKSEDSGC